MNMTYVGEVRGSEVRDAGGARIHTSDDSKALKWAMLNLPPGRIDVRHGVYEVGRLGAPAVGHWLEGRPPPGGQARITAPGDDAVFFDRCPKAPVTFSGMVIDAGTRSAVSTHDDGKPETRYDLDFVGCVVDGGYDHERGVGRDSKWGLNLHRWAGSVKRTTIRRIKREHGIYAHTAAGDIHLDECTIVRCGRSGIQHVGREHESGWSAAEIRITDSVFRDCGLWDGGAAITLQGMRRGVLRRVRSYIGEDEEFVSRYLETHPERARFGSTHFVNWNEFSPSTPNLNLPSEGIWLDDYAAWTAPKCGNGPGVSITNAETAMFTGTVSITTGSEFTPPLVIDAALDLGGLKSLTLLKGNEGGER